MVENSGRSSDQIPSGCNFIAWYFVILQDEVITDDDEDAAAMDLPIVLDRRWTNKPML